jgi:hypothetical protein
MNDNLDHDVLRAADAAQASARTAVIEARGTHHAVVVAAPAGAGKSYFVGQSIGAFRKAGLRVVAVSPTNEQAFGLVNHASNLNPGLNVAFMPATGVHLPGHIGSRRNVTEMTTKDVVDEGSPLVIATIDKLCYAADKGLAFDLLLIDEAYQASAAKYYTAAGVAPTHLLVGDSGQLEPFSTFDGADMWRGGAEDPLQTAVGVLRRNHNIEPIPMPITRRLDTRALPIARTFYPGHHFDAAALPGARSLSIGPGAGRSTKADKVLDVASRDGWAYATVAGASLLRADPVLAEHMVNVTTRLLQRGARWRDEDHDRRRPLTPADIAVGVSHNDQKDLLRALFDDAGLQSIAVDTANKLQGLTYQVMLVWHPLAGAESPDAFHLDPSRLCVLLTRHRQACIVFGRTSDRELLEGIPPATPGYLGVDTDPVLDGWDIHEQVFALLDPCRIEL